MSTEPNVSAEKVRILHHIEAVRNFLDACVGKSTPEDLNTKGLLPLLIKATGHGSRQMTSVDRFGFPRSAPKGARVVHGFRTGDIVKAIVPRGKHQGTHVGRVVIRSTGSFDIIANTGRKQASSWKHMRRLHAADGYGYQRLETPPTAIGGAS